MHTKKIITLAFLVAAMSLGRLVWHPSWQELPWALTVVVSQISIIFANLTIRGLST